MAARYPEIIDTHAHLSTAEFDRDRDAVVARAESAGVSFIEVGFDVDSSRKSVEIAGRAALAAAVGIHPHNATDYVQDLAAAWEDIAALARPSASVGTAGDAAGDLNPVSESQAGNRRSRVIAIGEIGLDYYRDLSPRRLQAECFEMGLDLAKATRLPVIIHQRDAEEDTLSLIRCSGVGLPIVFHCFTGNLAFARDCLDLGGYLGFGGVLTYPKNSELRDLLRFVPTDRILLETDAPYLAPQSHRGRRNEPSYLLETRDAIASSVNLDSSLVGRMARDNAVTVFGL